MILRVGRDAGRRWGRVLAGLRTCFLALVAPPQCPACGNRIAEAWSFCPRCARRVRRSWHREHRVRSRVRVEGCRDVQVWAAGPLTGAWGRAVRAFKDDPHPELGRLLAGPLARRLRVEGDAPGEPMGRPVVLVPVPMAPVRRRERGWNPPEHLAEVLAGMWRDTPAGEATCWMPARSEPGRLRRRRYRRPLRGLRARERRREVRGAFVIGSRPADPGERVWLVDDVHTTGATLAAAAAPLLEAGIPVCGALVLARTPRRPRRRMEGTQTGAGRPAP